MVMDCLFGLVKLAPNVSISSRYDTSCELMPEANWYSGFVQENVTAFWLAFAKDKGMLLDTSAESTGAVPPLKYSTLASFLQDAKTAVPSEMKNSFFSICFIIIYFFRYFIILQLTQRVSQY